MPCIQLSTSAKLSNDKQEALKKQFGKAIELLPRKSEKWLMCVFRPDTDIFFQGERGDIAFLEVDVFGTLDREACDALTVRLMEIVNTELGISQEKIYIKFGQTPIWGWNGNNF